MAFVPQLELEKSANKVYAVVGDTVVYSIKVTNNDFLTFNNVIVYDTLDEELAFEQGSVKIDGVSYPEENIFAGISLGSLNSGDTKTISFKAEITQVDGGSATNQAIAQFNYQLIGGPVNETEVRSNICTVQLFNADLQVTKVVDKEEANLGDTLTYTATVKNIGDVIAHSVLFKDSLPKKTQLIQGTVLVNGNVINGVELEKGILLGSINVGDEVVISYQVKVLGSNCSGELLNSANVQFKYELPDGSIGELTGESVSSTAYTQLSISTFKQMSIESYLTIPEVKPDIEAINNVSATIDILDCHVIETPQSVSQEGQILSGYKLIIHGKLNVVIEYTALDEEQSVHSAHYTVPFSTFVILPGDYSIGSKFEITGLTEDIYYHAGDIRNFFINATVLINVKILGC